MKFLFVSHNAESVDIAFRVLQEGDQVKYSILDKEELEVGDGIVPKVLNWEAEVGWADIVVFDDVKFGKDADRLRKQGKKVFGGSIFGDKLENDRQLGMDIAGSVGIKVPQHFTFNSVEKAKAFIKENPKKYVVKPNGQQERNLCFVGKSEDGSDLINFFDGYSNGKNSKFEKVDFTLQEVVDGIEVGISTYCDGSHFMPTKNINFEHKKLLAGNLGGNTGETGTVLFNRSEGKLLELTLNRLESLLVKNDYRGWVDTNCIANEEGVWFLEFTSRWGYPQNIIADELNAMPWASIIHDVAVGAMDDWRTTNMFATGIVVYSEGFPYAKAYKELGLNREITGINSQTIEHVHFGEVRREKERFYATGSTGWTLIATGNGTTAKESSTMAKAYAEKVDFPNKGFRNDIGAESDNHLKRLIEMGYLEY